jgi:hypothetical protein
VLEPLKLQTAVPLAVTAVKVSLKQAAAAAAAVAAAKNSNLTSGKTRLQ